MQFFSLLPLPDEKEPAVKVPVRSVLRNPLPVALLPPRWMNSLKTLISG